MKKIIFLLLFCFTCMNIFGQSIYHAFIPFETNSNLVQIDTNQQGNIWQIGTPQKLLFDSAFSPTIAIVTDTINSYPVNNLSSFEVKFYDFNNSMWGIGNLMFWHKYDMEYQKDGGYIEVKYDDDTNWTNIIYDTEPMNNGYGESFSSNFYDSLSTISGNIPAFTGTSNGWIQSNFYWIWQPGAKYPYHDSLTIRFTFKSDSVQTNQEGWLIDNIMLSLSLPSGISQNETNNVLSFINPNPVINVSMLKLFNTNIDGTELLIYNSLGFLKKDIKNISTETEIINSEYNAGIYYYNFIKDNQRICTGKFIVIK